MRAAQSEKSPIELQLTMYPLMAPLNVGPLFTPSYFQKRHSYNENK